MPFVTLTIRGLDSDLIRQARASAIRQQMRSSEWLNEAIREKLIKDSIDLPFNLDPIAQKTEEEGVFIVPKGTVIVGTDYTIDGRYICAAGEKPDEEAVTYQNAGTLVNLGYKVFWIR